MNDDKVILIDANSSHFKEIIHEVLEEKLDTVTATMKKMGYIHAETLVDKTEVAKVLGISGKKSWSELINQYSDPKRYDPALPFYKLPGLKEKRYKISDVITWREQRGRVERKTRYVEEVNEFGELLD